jgi:hypothetical protein
MKTLLAFAVFFLFAVTAGAQQTASPAAMAEAVRRYPDLAVANSPFNKEFVRLYNATKQDNPEELTRPNWPLTLAGDAAAVLGVRPVAPPIAAPAAALAADRVAKAAAFKRWEREMELKIERWKNETAVAEAKGDVGTASVYHWQIQRLTDQLEDSRKMGKIQPLAPLPVK